MTGEFVTAGHLGGYVAGGDPDTQYPEMWKWLVEREGIQSVLDVGCGDGAAVDYFLSIGVDALGVDGVEQDHPLIAVHDFTEGPFIPLGPFDLVWSCEFVEHVESRFIPNFIGALTAAPLVLLTHAVPGQAGWHHVNLQDGNYWRGVMSNAGYYEDAILTTEARARAHSYFHATGMAFRRRP